MKIVNISLYNPISFEMRGFHSLLEGANYDVHSIYLKELKSHTLELPTKEEYKLLVEKVKEEKPDLILIAVRSPFIEITKKVTDSLKHLGVPILWGGMHVILRPDQCIEYNDIICLGEGEDTLLELCERIKNKQDYSDVKNLWVKKNGQISRNPLRPLAPDLDKYPFPNFTDENSTFIENNTAYPGYFALNPYAKDELMVLSSRWCPYNCSFCCNSNLQRMYPGKIYRRRSVDNTIENLLKLKKRGIKKFYFMDEVFSKDNKWLQDFCPKYKKEINLPFKCLYFPSDINEDLVKALSEAGLTFVSMGVQTGSEKTRKELYNRPGTNKQILDAINILNKYNIEICLDLLLDNPLEAFEDKMESVNLFMEIPRGYQLNMYSMVFFPDTDLTKTAMARGIVTEEQLDGANRSSITNWGGGWQSAITKEDRFVDSLIFLLARTNLDKKIIKKFSKSKFLMKHPQVLISFANALDFYQVNSTKFVNYTRVTQKLVFNGELLLLLKLVSKKLKLNKSI